MPRRKKSAPNLKNKDKIVAQIYDHTGKAVEEMILPNEVFGAKINPKLIAQTVRVYLANQRSGTHSTKTRSQVRGSTRKIYRQKGTGRARHGDIKAPIFIGGGVAHGPIPTDYSLNLPRKMARGALLGALTDKWQQGSIKIVKGLDKIPPKTREIVNLLSKLAFLTPKKDKVLILTDESCQNIILAARNLPTVTTIPAVLLHTYAVLSHNNLLMTVDAVRTLQGLEEKSEVKPQNVKKKTVGKITDKSDKKVRIKR